MKKADWVDNFENNLATIKDKYSTKEPTALDNTFLQDMSQILIHMRQADASFLSKISEISAARTISQKYFDADGNLIKTNIPQNSEMAKEILEKYVEFANSYKDVDDVGVLGAFAPPYAARATSIQQHLASLNSEASTKLTSSV